MAPSFNYLYFAAMAILLFGNLFFSSSASRQLSDIHKSFGVFPSIPSPLDDKVSSQMPQFENVAFKPTPTTSDSRSFFDHKFRSEFPPLDNIVRPPMPIMSDSPPVLDDQSTSQFSSFENVLGSPTPVMSDSPSFIDEQPISQSPSIENMPVLPTQPVSQFSPFDNMPVWSAEPIPQSPFLENIPTQPTPVKSQSPPFVEDQPTFKFPSIDNMITPLPPTKPVNTEHTLPSPQASTNPSPTSDAKSDFPFRIMEHVPGFQPIANVPYIPIVPSNPSTPDFPDVNVIVSLH